MLALLATSFSLVWASDAADWVSEQLAEVRELHSTDPAAASERLNQISIELATADNAESLYAVALEWAIHYDARSDYIGGEARLAELLATYGQQWQPIQRLRVELAMANFMRRQQRRDEAMVVYERALPLALSRRDDDPSAYGELLLGRGAVQHDRGEYDLAIADYLEALRQFERGQQPRNQVSALTRLGISALRARDPESALDYFLGAEAALAEDPSAELAILIYPNLGIVYQELQRPEDAIAAYQEGYALAQQLNRTLAQAQSLLNIGTIYYGDERYTEALEYYQQSLVISERAEIQYGVLVNLINIAQVQLKLGQYNQGLSTLEPALALAEAGDHKLELRKIYKQLTELHTATGDYQQALRAQAQFIDLNETLFNESRDRAISELRVQYETDLQAKKLLVKEAQLVQARNRTRLLSVILVMGLGVIALGVWYYRQRVQTLQLLYARNRDLVDLQHGPIPRRAGTSVVVAVDRPDAPDEVTESDQLHDVYLRLRQIMKDQALYRDSGLTIAKLASVAGSNRNYVSTALSRYGTGNFASFVNSFRISEARRVLSGSGAVPTMLDLIDQCGFSSRSAFYQAFKREVGMTPLQFRELALEDQAKAGQATRKSA